MTTFEDSLQTGAGNAYKWATVGDTLAGTVTAKNIVTRPNFDGVDEDVPVIQIRDAEGTEYDAWLGKSSMRRAVAQALAKAVAPRFLRASAPQALSTCDQGNSPLRSQFTLPFALSRIASTSASDFFSKSFTRCPTTRISSHSLLWTSPSTMAVA